MAYQDLNKKEIDSARIWGSKWILLHIHVVLSACTLHPGRRGVSASSIMITKNLIASFFIAALSYSCIAASAIVQG